MFLWSWDSEDFPSPPLLSPLLSSPPPSPPLPSYTSPSSSQFMKAGEDVFAGGDIARFPLPLIGDSANIGHWQLAHKHGRVAAKNMLGKNQPFDSIPFFWTVLYGKSLRYCGEIQLVHRQTHTPTDRASNRQSIINSIHAHTDTHTHRHSMSYTRTYCHKHCSCTHRQTDAH